MSDGRTISQRLINISVILGAVIAIQGALSWVFKDKIDDYILSTATKDQPSTRTDLSKEMNIRKELVVIEIGNMYREFKDAQKNIQSFNETWIPYLEKEKLVFHVGFFADIDSKGNVKIKYRDFDGEEYRSWHDEQGWYYMKQGYRFYK